MLKDMLTAKQIKKLPKGTYTNRQLNAMFPKTHGLGRTPLFEVKDKQKKEYYQS